MKKLLIGAALLAMTACANAATYSVEGVTVHVPDNCRSSACVSVDAPGYGYYHGGRRAKTKTPKDAARIAATAKKDGVAASPAPAAASTPPAETVSAPAAEKAPETPPAAIPDATAR